MKTKLVVVAAIGMLLAGCGGSTEESPAPETTTAATTTQAQTTETVTLVETITEEAPAEEPAGIAVSGPGGTCGTVSSTAFPGLDGKEVTIESGDVDCVEAYEIMMTYVNTEASGGGNTNMQSFGEWACSIPSAARSEELQQGAVCEKPSGERIYLPN